MSSTIAIHFIFWDRVPLIKPRAHRSPGLAGQPFLDSLLSPLPSAKATDMCCHDQLMWLWLSKLSSAGSCIRCFTDRAIPGPCFSPLLRACLSIPALRRCIGLDKNNAEMLCSPWAHTPQPATEKRQTPFLLYNTSSRAVELGYGANL